MADKDENLAVAEKPKSDPLTNMFNVVSDIKQKPVGERRQAFIEEQARILPEKVKADVDYQRARFDLETSGKEARAKEGQAQTLLQETDIKQRRESIDKNALPVFSPTQEDLTSYAQLGSAIATLGLMLGGGGKVPAKAAISSMTGMLNGWRTGRKDLYERESKSFDKEFQRVTAIRKSLQDDLSTAMQLWPTKRKDAMDIIESLVNKTGAQSVFGKLLYSGQYKAGWDFLGNAQKVEEAARIKDEDNKRKDATTKATADYREKMIGFKQDDINIKRQIANAKEKPSDEKEKTTAQIKNNFDKSRDSLTSMTDVLSRLDDPVIKKQWEQGSVEFKRFLSERPSAGKEDTMFNALVKQKSLQSLPAEVRELIVIIASARNDYYKSLSGTAVSGSEATRNFGSIVQPTDNLDQLKTKASIIAKKFANKVQLDIDSYRFAPALAKRAKQDIDNAKKYYELPKGIPPGSKKIGTSETLKKDVYEAPDGSKHVPDDEDDEDSEDDKDE